MNFQAVIYLALAGVALFFAVKGAFRVDTKVEEVKRQAVRISSWCQANGLPLLSQLLTTFAVGDKSGLLTQVGNIYEVVTDEAQSKQALEHFLRIQLDKRLETQEGREALVEYVEKKLNVEIPRDLLKPKATPLSAPNSPPKVDSDK